LRALISALSQENRFMFLRQIMSTVAVLPTSESSWERACSEMNLITNKLRLVLHNISLNDLLMTYRKGPRDTTYDWPLVPCKQNAVPHKGTQAPF
jgi:hypothetical protein